MWAGSPVQPVRPASKTKLNMSNKGRSVPRAVDELCMPVTQMLSVANQFLPEGWLRLLGQPTREARKQCPCDESSLWSTGNSLKVSPDQVQRWKSGLCRAGGCSSHVAQKLLSPRWVHQAPESTPKLTGCPCMKPVIMTLGGESMVFWAYSSKQGSANWRALL